MVGAIIGRSGGTIKQITQQTRARVDVHRKENAGALEKVITIYGNPDNCSEACLKILEVMQTEATNTNRGEIPLKILAHNNLIGRIIGKSGNTIKKIMEQTDTKITVSSSIHDVNSFNLERIITIKGSLENICKAESMISQRLRQSYESDLQAIAPQAVMFPGLHPMAMMSTIGQPNYPMAGPSSGSGGRGGGGAGGPNTHPFGIYNTSPYGVPPLLYSPTGGGPGLHHPTAPTLTAGFPAIPGGDQTKETVFVYIPNSAVGAIIGTGGTTIREMILNSGANIKVAQPTKEEAERVAQDMRRVTIVGNPESQWKAQYMIFRKVTVEGFSAIPQDSLSPEPKLKVEILIPSSQVGRIIGKGGSVVREMQRNTRAIIKLPEESVGGGSGGGGDGGAEETPVYIIGDFLSTQAAQRQIRALVSRSTVPSTVGKPTKPKDRDNKDSSRQQTAPPTTTTTPAANHQQEQQEQRSSPPPQTTSPTDQPKEQQSDTPPDPQPEAEA
ncbi:unnamed protein product [Medioppia subpectinata]|uniref:K Homology domain-containing protein n=1 Tax=Medioppia subpectinata TaxID=1979941 RepID=A0A7R9KUB8_9ACAR|nr:unnamed protein product [Medioppia subpectinata]CAG2109616.1 unnamed protein product [Medioppia subpectinata]